MFLSLMSVSRGFQGGPVLADIQLVLKGGVRRKYSLQLLVKYNTLLKGILSVKVMVSGA